MGYQPTASDGDFLLLGALSPLVAAGLRWIELSGAADTLLLSCIGAVGAWTVKALLDLLKKRFIRWYHNRKNRISK